MIKYSQEITEDREARNRLLRRVYNTPDGKIALTMLLTDLGYYSQANGVEANALRNFAIHLLEDIGILHQDNLWDITEALLSIRSYSPPSEGENEGD